ncbi:MAG: hypothetical protein PUF06_04325 [Veillonellaceae bacterium]|nr:hypothetical protein [Veillonellaceae bacterium]
MTFSEFVISVRKRLKLSQKQLATAIMLVTQQSIDGKMITLYLAIWL